MKKISMLLIFLVIIFSAYTWFVSSSHPRPHGIILISLDTLRADHLGTYGYYRDTNPYIDAFAQENIVFENAVAQSPNTLPSHMSIMTSLYPYSHGVWGKTEDDYDNNVAPLDDKHVTLAELLRDGGYQTAGFTDGGFLRAIFGFDQGFDIYESKKVGIARILPQVKRWLDENKSKPFFLFIHCYDIHSPYDPPPPYDKIFHDFEYTGHLSPTNENLLAATRKQLEVNEDDLRHFIALYDGGIRYTDEKIGEFLSYLRDTGVYDQSLIIITSDHGEEFKEHGGFLHWQLHYRPELHVPLIVHVPGYPKKQVRISELARSIDLLPTIIEIAGLPVHQQAQGRSLQPLIKREENFLNHSLWRVINYFKKDSSISFAEYHRNDNYSIIADEYQLIYYMKSNYVKLFDLSADPLAKKNIAKDNDTIAKQLLAQLKEVYGLTPATKAPAITVDEQTRQQLKTLGYME